MARAVGGIGNGRGKGSCNNNSNGDSSSGSSNGSSSGHSHGNGKHRRPSVATPLGEDVTLYPFDPDADPSPELALLTAIVDLAQRDADWLTNLDRRAPSTWTPHERRRHTRMTADDIVPPRFWLSS